MKKHIGFLIMNFNNGGGTERVTSIIANNLYEQGYKITIFSCQYGENNIFPLDDGIDIVSLNGEKEPNPFFRKINVYKNLKKEVKNRNINVMIAVDVALFLYLYPLQLKSLCKGIAWEHFNYYISNNRLASFSRKLAAKYADCIIVLGKNDLNNYKNNYKKINRIEYIYNPLALSFDKQTSLSNKRVIAVGRLHKQKGFDLLLNAWKIVEENDSEWSLDIFGIGSLENDLKKQISDNKLTRVSLKGYSKDINDEFVKSSIFVLSSRFEGFVLVLMEALAKGLPCVSFNCKEGPAEIIQDGVNGYLVEPENFQMLAEKILALIKNEEIRRKFKENSKIGLERFEIDDIIKKWIKILENL